MVYFPQLGYLCAIPLPEVYPNEEMERHTPHNWQFNFNTEVSIYYKNPQMRDLDATVGDIHGFIVDREVEIMHELLCKVVDCAGMLYNVADVVAELDCLLAFADAAVAST